jgi:hypothetical protein
MPRPAANEGNSKFQRYRESQKKKGMKLVRIWVPDPKAPGFAEEISRQSALIRASPDEAEALDFIEALAADWADEEP